MEAYYHSLIWILQWIVELRKPDMTVKTSLMQGLCVRVGVNEWMVTHVNTHENMAGIFQGLSHSHS